MRPLHIDFAPHSWRRTLHRTRPAEWMVVAIAALALCATAVAAFALRAEQHEYERQLAEAGVRARLVSAQAPRRAAQPGVPATQAAAVNAIVSQLNLPWRAVHDALAAGTPSSVALLALEPDARRHSLRITAETRDSEGMVGYVEQLKRQELFKDVVLVSHEINDADPNKPLRFELEASWSVQ